MAEHPVEVGGETRMAPGRTILLIDDHDVLYRSGTERVLVPFERHPGNPLIKDRGRPWEVALAWNSVYRDPQTGRYQLWYQAFAGREAWERSHQCVVCYAESVDGIQWVKPSLGIHTFNDAQETNIVLVGNGGTSLRYTNSVVVDPGEANPGKRYKMAYYDFAVDRGREYPGLNVAFSPDGIHWTKHPHAPLSRTSYGGQHRSVPFSDETGRDWDIPLSMSDALDVFYDPQCQGFVICGKMWIDGPDGSMYWKHGMGRIESQDFIHWSKPQLLLTPDEFDPAYVEFHTSPVFWYNDCYLALLQILHRAQGGGVIDIELAVSRDGLDWKRPFRDRFVLPRREGEHFDSGSIFTNATPVILEDEMRFYYGAYSRGATDADNHALTSGIGLSTLPRDRFAGLRPVASSAQPTLPRPLEHVGQVTLKPIELSLYRAIEVNADASGGTIWGELLDANGLRVRGFSREDVLPIEGDALRHPLRWREREIAELPAGQYMLRLHLQRATVYAVTFVSEG
jgi:hypothetical protein